MARGASWPAVAAVLSLLFATPLHAQAAGSQRPGRFHVGPFWLTPRIVLRNAGIDDNVFNDAGAGTSDRQAVLTPSLDVQVPVSRRLRLSGTGALGLNYFQREDSERSTDLTGTARAEVDVGPFTVFGLLGRGRAKQRFSVEIDERLDRTTSSYGGGLSFKPSRRFTLTGQSVHHTLGFEDGAQVGGDSVQAALDRESTTTSGALSYALTPRTNLVFSADVIDERFTAQAAGAAAEARSYRYLGGFTFNTGALLRGGVRVGLRDFPEDPDQTVPAYDGLSLAVDTGLPLGEHARLALVATRDVSYAVTRAPGPDGPRRNSFTSFVYGGTLDLELPLSLLARGGLSFEQADYVLPYAGNVDRRDDVRIYNVALFRAFGRSLRVGGNVEWARRTSNLPGSGYRRRSYGLTAEYTP